MYLIAFFYDEFLYKLNKVRRVFGDLLIYI